MPPASHTYMLDGDNVRHGLNRDLGFTDDDRVENIRRVAEVARLMADAGLIVLVSFISPFRAERQHGARTDGRGRVRRGLRRHAVRGMRQARSEGPLRQGARAAQIKNFTGVDSPYEAPENPEIHLKTLGKSPEEMVEALENVASRAGQCRTAIR